MLTCSAAIVLALRQRLPENAGRRNSSANRRQIGAEGTEGIKINE